MPSPTLSSLLEQYQALAGKITPGKWEVNGATHIVKFGEDYASIAKVCNPRPADEPSGKRGHVMEDADIGNPRFHEAAANAEFIAFAANHFPTLVTELEKAEDKAEQRRIQLAKCSMAVIGLRDGAIIRDYGTHDYADTYREVAELRAHCLAELQKADAALARNQEALRKAWGVISDYRRSHDYEGPCNEVDLCEICTAAKLVGGEILRALSPSVPAAKENKKVGE